MELQRDDKLLNRKIEDEVKKYGVLKDSFTKIAESELGKNKLILALSKTRLVSFERISKIEEMDNKCNTVYN
jgi:hypothetical protein